MQFSTMSDHRKARLSGSCSRSVRSSVTKPDSPNPEERSGCALDDAKHWRPGSRLRKFPFMLRGIAPGTTVHELRQFLGQAGTIKDIYIPVHHINRTPRNYCFVEYEDEDDGKKALELLNGQIMNGVRVLFRVANSDPKTPEEMREVYDKRTKGNGRFDGVRDDNSPYEGWRERSRSTPSVLRRYYRSRRYSHRDHRDYGYLSRRGYRSRQRSCSSSRSGKTHSYSRSRSCSRCHRERRHHHDRSKRRAYYTRGRQFRRRDSTSSRASTVHSVSSSSRSSISRDSSAYTTGHHRRRHLTRGRHRNSSYRSRSASSSNSRGGSRGDAKEKRVQELRHRRRKRSASPRRKQSNHSRHRSRRIDKHHGSANKAKKVDESAQRSRSSSRESLGNAKKRRKGHSGREKEKSRHRRKTSSRSLSSCAITGEVRGISNTGGDGTRNGEDGNTGFRKGNCSSKKCQISSMSSNLAPDRGDVEPSMHEKPEKTKGTTGSSQGQPAELKASQASNAKANMGTEDSGKKRNRESDDRHVEERRKRKHSKRS